MIKVTIPEIDLAVPDLERAQKVALDAAREKARRKGGRRGENLIGVNQAAADAYVEEVERQGGPVKVTGKITK